MKEYKEMTVGKLIDILESHAQDFSKEAHVCIFTGDWGVITSNLNITRGSTTGFDGKELEGYTPPIILFPHFDDMKGGDS